MGRPPCCDKVGIKKGPWTPEEDIILVSYIQEHGPGNWRSVPTNTGLLRCSKSCRLRWTNYLRPGIKRGSFTPHEEGMIIHLQALLGNKWAAIASYLPQRTDNDIKNYWNTHLKKKIKKYQSPMDPHIIGLNSTTNTQLMTTSTKSDIEKKNSGFTFTNQASLLRYSQTTTYASSTENISRLLEGWMKSSPKAKVQENDEDDNSNNSNNNNNNNNNNNGDGLDSTTHMQCNQANKVEQESCDLISHEEFESLLSIDNISSMGWDKSSSDSTLNGPQIIHGPQIDDEKAQSMSLDIKHIVENQNPLSFLKKWLLEESGGHVDGMMELATMSDIFPNL